LSLFPQPAGVDINWKSILVETGPSEYREIFHLQSLVNIQPTASRIVHTGKEAVLMTMTSGGGNGGCCFEGYWRFDSSGPHALDFSAVTCFALDLGGREIVTHAQKSDAECHACGGVSGRARSGPSDTYKRPALTTADAGM